MTARAPGGTRRAVSARVARLGLVVALVAAACDNRACLAQSDLFEGYRAQLIEECCACLAESGTRAPGAACAEAVLGEDGAVGAPPDAGPTIPVDAPFNGDDLDSTVDGPGDGVPGEIPCLCGQAENQCVAALSTGLRLVVTGACVAQGSTPFEEVPCGVPCRGVLSFDPISGPDDG